MTENKFLSIFFRCVFISTLIFSASLSSAVTTTSITATTPGFNNTMNQCGSSSFTSTQNCGLAGGNGNFFSMSNGSTGFVDFTGLTSGSDYVLKFVCAQSASGSTLTFAAGSGLSITGTTTFSGLPNGTTTTWSLCSTQIHATAATARLNVTITGGTSTLYFATYNPSIQVALPAPVLTFNTPASASVNIGSSLTNAATSTLSGGSYGSITYSSGTPAVATVNSSGVVTPVSTGTSIITATQAATTFNNQATQTYTLTVTLASQSITSSATASSINVGATSTVSASTGSGTGAVTYSSSNTAVATVNSSTGEVAGVSAGSVTITATKAADSTYASATATTNITVTATPTPVLTFTTPSSASVNMGAGLTNAVTSTLSGGSYGSISYSSATPAVATVDASGVITPVSVGTSVITATQVAVTGVNAQATQTYTVTVNATQTPTLTFATQNTASVMLSGALTNAASTSIPSGGAMSYISSNTSVATVDASGVITPLTAGTSVITATQAASAGVNTLVSTTYTLTVNALLTPTLTFLTPTSASVVLGGALTNAATSSNSGGSYGSISYSSSNTGVATVNSSGVITTVASGAAVITATQAAVAGVNAQTTQTYTLTVQSTNAALSSLSLSTGSLSPTFASGTTSYTASVANSVSSITVTPTRNQANATITVNGTTVASGSASGSISLNVGSNTLTTIVTAQDGTTTQTYSTTVTRAAALAAQASFVVSASPSALNATTTTSTVSTTGGSGTGAVSYAMTAGTCTLNGTTVAAGTANETCIVTATKAADSTYLAAIATVNITVSRRATLAAAATDASVAKTQGTQLMQSQKFVQTQVQNITSHLDTFRHSFNLMPSNMGVSINAPSLGPISPLFYKVKDVWSGNSGESTASSLRKVGMKDAAQPSTDNKLYNDYNNPEDIDEQAAIEQRIYAYERKQETYSLWSAGTIDTGLFKTGDNKDVTNKFRVNGLTIGLDYKVGPRAIIGAALGVGQGSNTTQELDSKVKSTQQSFTGYGMLGFGDNWVVDGLLGYSRLSFTGDRTTSDGAATLGMNRTGDSTFASTSLSKIFSFGAFRVAPFVREDVTHIRLNQYNETGAADYALGYDTARYTATATSAGLHFANDIYLDRGKLTTSAKLSANRMRTGSLSQDVYYADTGMAGGIYTLQQSSSYQNSRSLSLGIMYSNKAGDGIDIGWMGAIGANQYKLNGVRFGARFAM
jgi:uncharacterized protein YjdB